MFILISRYVKPLDEVDRALVAHRAFLARMHERKMFLASGPLVPRNGGAILANARDRHEIESILSEDPFVQLGISEYEVLEWAPNRTTESFGAALSELARRT